MVVTGGSRPPHAASTRGATRQPRITAEVYLSSPPRRSGPSRPGPVERTFYPGRARQPRISTRGRVGREVAKPIPAWPGGASDRPPRKEDLFDIRCRYRRGMRRGLVVLFLVA